MIQMVRRWWKGRGTQERARDKSLQIVETLTNLLLFARRREREGCTGMVDRFMKWQTARYRAAIRMARIGMGFKAFRMTGRDWDENL